MPCTCDLEMTGGLHYCESAPDPFDHGPGCDGPWNCVCQPIPDECPAGGEHQLTEVTTIPLGPSGRCEVLIVCEVCGEEMGHAGWDSVL